MPNFVYLGESLLVNELKSYFVVLDTSPRRRCVAGAYVRSLDAYIYSPDMYQQHATGGSWPEKYVERGFVA